MKHRRTGNVVVEALVFLGVLAVLISIAVHLKRNERINSLAAKHAEIKLLEDQRDRLEKAPDENRKEIWMLEQRITVAKAEIPNLEMGMPLGDVKAAEAKAERRSTGTQGADDK